jgi:hypothetical protein
MKKEIRMQYQGLTSPSVLQKEIGFVSLNFDNIKLTIDAYDGFPCSGTPRTDSKIEVMDEKEVFLMSPEELLSAVRFYQTYATLGSNVARFKNTLNLIMPDRYKNAVTALKKAKIGLKV